MFRRVISILVIVSFTLSCFQSGYAQPVPPQAGVFNVNELPVPGKMVDVSAPFVPLALKGLIINPQKPLEFQFIIDTGDTRLKSAASPDVLKSRANDLVKYFLASLTIPESDLWVNLSPYEKNRMIPDALGRTNLGRDLLAQDYILKQLTASLIYPERDLGKEFWRRVYAQAQEQFGTTNIPVNTFNKVWILPDQAQVYEHGAAAYVTKATLKVMLDEDYLALSHHVIPANATAKAGQAGIQKRINLASSIIRQIILPEITKEVNTGKNFAPLRQIYNALILAKWYKQTIQNSLLDAVYTNKNKITGVNLNDPTIKEKIYNRYLQAYKKGVFNYIKDSETPGVSDATLGKSIPRKYFSGGTLMAIHELKTDGAMSAIVYGSLAVLTVAVVAKGRTAFLNWQRPQESKPGSVAVNIADMLGIRVEKYETPEATRKRVAYMMANELIDNNRHHRDTVWILPTGGTYELIYKEFREIVWAKRIRLDRLHIFNMDEYCPDDDYQGDWKNDPHSYQYFMNHHLYHYLRGYDLGWDPRHAHFLDGQAKDERAESEQYEESIRKADVQTTFGGLGPTAHAAFNDPRIISHDGESIRDFNEFSISANGAEARADIEELLTKHWSSRQDPLFAATLMPSDVMKENGVTMEQLQVLAHKLLMKQRTSIALNNLQFFKIAELQGIADRVAQKLGLGNTPKVEFVDEEGVRYSRTRRVAPAVGTIRANIIYYLDDVTKMPVEAYTVGIGTMRDKGRIIIAALGVSKAEAVHKSLETPMSLEVPASLFQGYLRKVFFIIDEKAGSKIINSSAFRTSTVIESPEIDTPKEPRLLNPEAKPTVLLVDDHLEQMVNLRMLLEAEGYMVQETRSGEQALAILKEDPHISCVISDVHMQKMRMDGVELAKYVSDLNPKLPFVLRSNGFFLPGKKIPFFNKTHDEELVQYIKKIVPVSTVSKAMNSEHAEDSAARNLQDKSDLSIDGRRLTAEDFRMMADLIQESGRIFDGDYGPESRPGFDAYLFALANNAHGDKYIDHSSEAALQRTGIKIARTGKDGKIEYYSMPKIEFLYFLDYLIDHAKEDAQQIFEHLYKQVFPNIPWINRIQEHVLQGTDSMPIPADFRSIQILAEPSGTKVDMVQREGEVSITGAQGGIKLEKHPNGYLLEVENPTEKRFKVAINAQTDRVNIKEITAYVAAGGLMEMKVAYPKQAILLNNEVMSGSRIIEWIKAGKIKNPVWIIPDAKTKTVSIKSIFNDRLEKERLEGTPISPDGVYRIDHFLVKGVLKYYVIHVPAKESYEILFDAAMSSQMQGYKLQGGESLPIPGNFLSLRILIEPSGKSMEIRRKEGQLHMAGSGAIIPAGGSPATPFDSAKIRLRMRGNDYLLEVENIQKEKPQQFRIDLEVPLMGLNLKEAIAEASVQKNIKFPDGVSFKKDLMSGKLILEWIQLGKIKNPLWVGTEGESISITSDDASAKDPFHHIKLMPQEVYVVAKILVNKELKYYRVYVGEGKKSYYILFDAAMATEYKSPTITLGSHPLKITREILQLFSLSENMAMNAETEDLIVTDENRERLLGKFIMTTYRDRELIWKEKGWRLSLWKYENGYTLCLNKDLKPQIEVMIGKSTYAQDIFDMLTRARLAERITGLIEDAKLHDLAIYIAKSVVFAQKLKKTGRRAGFFIEKIPQKEDLRKRIKEIHGFIQTAWQQLDPDKRIRLEEEKQNIDSLQEDAAVENNPFRLIRILHTLKKFDDKIYIPARRVKAVGRTVKTDPGYGSHGYSTPPRRTSKDFAMNAGPKKKMEIVSQQELKEFEQGLELQAESLGYRVDQHTKFVLLLGDTIDKSRYHVLINQAFQKKKDNIILLPVKTMLQDLGRTISLGKLAGRVIGFDITSPHKVEAANYMDTLDQSAQEVGAVNIVMKQKDGTLKGYSCDGQAWVYWYTQVLKKNLTGKKIVILGGGGAARGVIQAIFQQTLNTYIAVYDTQKNIAEDLVTGMSAHYPKAGLSAVSKADLNTYIKLADMVINLTGSGKSYDDRNPALPDIDYRLLKGKEAIDGNYRFQYDEPHNEFLKRAGGAGAAIYNGFGFSVSNAVPIYQFFTGKKISYQDLVSIAKIPVSQGGPGMMDAAQQAETNGGIDMNELNVDPTGKKIMVHFDPAQLNALLQGGFEGFAPVITDFQYIESPFPLLLAPA